MVNDTQTTEEEALVLLWEWAQLFGWSYLVFTRSSVEDYIGRRLTPIEWALIRTSPEWEALTERSFTTMDHMHKVVDDLLGDD